MTRPSALTAMLMRISPDLVEDGLPAEMNERPLRLWPGVPDVAPWSALPFGEPASPEPVPLPPLFAVVAVVAFAELVVLGACVADLEVVPVPAPEEVVAEVV